MQHLLSRQSRVEFKTMTLPFIRMEVNLASSDRELLSMAMVNEHVFLLRSSQLGQPYLYYLLNFDLVLAQIIHKGSSKGAQPGLNQDEVRTSSFVKPVKGLLDIFNRTVEPGIRKQLLLGKECQALSELRDSLLPKLISGEIRIPDAEKMLEEVGF